MALSVSDLVAQADLGLRALVRASAGSRHISWASSSDLADPTPFLLSNQLLLTTGSQFLPETAAETYRAYVQSLLQREVLGVGFGVGLAHDTTPEGLIIECSAANLPLVEVPYETSFLAISQRVARAVERDARQRDDWTLGALRALSAAALQRGDIDAVLRTLAAQLGTSVLLFDGEGALERSFGARRALAEEDLSGEVRKLIDGGRRAAVERKSRGLPIVLQTLGPPGELSGVLGAGGIRFDRAARTVLAAAVALIEVGTAQERRWAKVSLALSAVVLRLLEQAQLPLADEIARAAGSRLPRGPVGVVVGVPSRPQRAAAVAARETAAASPRLLALESGRLLCVVPVHAIEGVARRWTGWGLAVGSSEVAGVGEWAHGRRRADAAAATSKSGTWQRWEQLSAPSSRSEQARRGAALLAAIEATPAGSAEAAAARAWFAQNCSWGGAARELHVHPHTLRDRVQGLASRLSIDISSFDGRVTLWTALQGPAG